MVLTVAITFISWDRTPRTVIIYPLRSGWGGPQFFPRNMANSFRAEARWKVTPAIMFGVIEGFWSTTNHLPSIWGGIKGRLLARDFAQQCECYQLASLWLPSIGYVQNWKPNVWQFEEEHHLRNIHLYPKNIHLYPKTLMWTAIFPFWTVHICPAFGIFFRPSRRTGEALEVLDEVEQIAEDMDEVGWGGKPWEFMAKNPEDPSPLNHFTFGL